MNWTRLSISVLTLLINSFFVMMFWNWFFVTSITGVNEIGFVQAMGIFSLCGLLFKEDVFKIQYE